MFKKYKEKRRIARDKISMSPEYFPVELSENEKNFLIEAMRNSKKYLEFGSGGSTFLALLNTKIQVFSVESDLKWIEYLREWNFIKEHENKRLFFKWIDIGKTGEWGVPLEEGKRELWSNYSKSVFEGVLNDYDLVFIDGRFRVACALQVIINCKQDVKIIIHDFNNRPQYHILLEFLEIVDTIDTMALFRVKNVDFKRMKEVYEEVKFIYE